MIGKTILGFKVTPPSLVSYVQNEPPVKLVPERGKFS
jgi:hypothetical protein